MGSWRSLIETLCVSRLAEASRQGLGSTSDSRDRRAANKCLRRCRVPKEAGTTAGFTARLAPEIVQRIIVSLNAPPTRLEDLQTLHSLVVALEKEVELAQTPG